MLLIVSCALFITLFCCSTAIFFPECYVMLPLVFVMFFSSKLGSFGNNLFTSIRLDKACIFSTFPGPPHPWDYAGCVVFVLAQLNYGAPHETFDA